MSTYDDYDGVYFTAQSVRLFHPELTPHTEILVIDNHPDGPCATDLKNLEDWIEGYRYVPYTRSHGTSVKDIVFREATAEFVLCVDSHVMFVPGALGRLLRYFEANPTTPDLLQGPLLYDDLKTVSTHMNPQWSSGMNGVWATDERGADPDAPPFEIPMQGLGAFACRRAAWPGFNPRLRGFGSEEGYIHEKFRQAGARTLCLPFLRWMHRFGRPMGPPYENTWDDRIRNYLIVARETGQDPMNALQHFRDFVGAETVNRIIATAETELSDPLDVFDAIYSPGVAVNSERRIRAFTEVSLLADPLTSKALTHRAIVEEANRLGLKNFLVLNNGALPRPDDLLNLKNSHPVFPVGIAGVAIRQPAYERLLAEIPADPQQAQTWLGIHGDIESYYASLKEEAFND